MGRILIGCPGDPVGPAERVASRHAADSEVAPYHSKAETKPDPMPLSPPDFEPPPARDPILSVALADVAAGMGGFKIIGDVGDNSGAVVDSIGDLNDDGFAEILIGAPFSDAGGENAGAAYVVWGKADGDPVNLADVAAGVGGFRILGESGPVFQFDTGDLAGSDLGTINDLNGDGLPEVLVLSNANDATPDRPNAGAVYVVWGKPDNAPVSLSDLSAGLGGFKILAEAPGDFYAGSTGSMRDLNGDGLDEVLIGAPSNDAGRPDGGAAYVVWGKTDNTPVDLTAVAAGVGGFKINAEPSLQAIPRAGQSVAAISDLNGDGLSELLVGAPGDSSGGDGAGAAYVVWGKVDGEPVHLADVAAGVGGFKIIGETPDDLTGYRVAAIGDLDSDGHEEILASAIEKNVVDASGNILINNVGAAYVVWGKTDSAPVDLDIVTAGSGGYRMLGEAESNVAGSDIAAIADLNGDGRPEVLVGAPGNDADNNGAGAVYVVWGKADGVPLDLTAVSAGTGGLKIIGQAMEETLFFGEQAGASVGSVADLNGDDRPEILIGAPFSDEHATPFVSPLSSSGAVYVVFSSPDWIGA